MRQSSRTRAACDHSRGGALSPLVVAMALGCRFGDGDPSVVVRPAECPGEEQQPLVGATTDETFLGMPEPRRRALVELVDASGASGALCSGTFVAPGWVLSAAHCLQIPELGVRVRSGSLGPPNTLTVSSIEQHESLDVALLAVDFGSLTDVTDVTDLGVAPIMVADTEPPIRTGEAVELAGYGTTESGAFGELRFLVESIIEVNETSIRVDGFGRTGACTGDSGGPMLTRNASGDIVVLGVLSSGAASCRDKDRFVRTSAVQDWIRSIIGSEMPTEPACGGIDAEGRCFHGAAIWCDGDVLRASSCTDGDVRCGWDDAELGFRCIDAASDPCRGVDGVGACEDGRALTCAAGSLFVETCGPCADCRIDGHTGEPHCAPTTP